MVDLEAGGAALRRPARYRLEQTALPGLQDQLTVPDGVVQRENVRQVVGLGQERNAADAVVIEQPPAFVLGEYVEARGMAFEFWRHVGIRTQQGVVRQIECICEPKHDLGAYRRRLLLDIGDHRLLDSGPVCDLGPGQAQLVTSMAYPAPQVTRMPTQFAHRSSPLPTDCMHPAHASAADTVPA